MKHLRWFYRRLGYCGCIGDVHYRAMMPPCTNPTHCWDWQGTRDANGYGKTRTILHGKQEVYAHRIAWILHNGRQTSLEVCHSCDRPRCCNPGHLWEGTHRANHDDATRKRRHSSGARHSRPQKLTPDAVRAIRALYAGSTLTHQQIAAQYGVSQVAITQILNRKIWAHVE